MPWEDPDFVPSGERLGAVGGDTANAKSGKAKNGVEFPSPDPDGPFKGEDPMVFDEDIDPNDVNQGMLGDCWFLAAISGVAEIPDRIRDNFIDEEVTDDGKYRIKLFKHGVEQTVEVDAHFPTMYNGQTFAFSKAKGAEMWVPLLEKAYAKVHGSYAAIEGGQMAVGFFDLTGAPGFNVDLEKISKEELWEDLVEWDEASHLMGCGPKRAEKGLHTGHAYTLLGVVELSNGVKLVKMRNPWGQGEWTGDWSDDSPLWTPALSEEAGQVDANDGIFFMSLDDFCAYIGDMSCNMWMEDFKLAVSCDQAQGTPSGQKLMKVEVLEDTVGVFCMPHYDLRGQKAAVKGSFPLEYSFTVFNPDGEVIEDTGSMLGYVPWNHIAKKHDLEEGTYHVLIKWSDPEPKANLHREVRLGVYAEEDAVEITPLAASDEQIRNFCAAHLKESLLEGEAQEDQYWDVYRSANGLSKVYVGKGDWAWKLTFGQGQNVELVADGRDSQGNVYIKPGEATFVGFFASGVQWATPGCSYQSLRPDDVPGDVAWGFPEDDDFEEEEIPSDPPIPPYASGHVNTRGGAKSGFQEKEVLKKKEQKAKKAQKKLESGGWFSCFSGNKNAPKPPKGASKKAAASSGKGKGSSKAASKGAKSSKKKPAESSEEDEDEDEESSE